MERFRTHDRIEVACDEVGAPDGPPLVLLHGFASSTQANWDATGVRTVLAEGGHRTFGVDARGHAQSAAAIVSRFDEHAE